MIAHPKIWWSIIYTSVYLPTYLSTYLSIYLPIYLSTYLSIYLSIYLYVVVYITLHIYIYICVHHICMTISSFSHDKHIPDSFSMKYPTRLQLHSLYIPIIPIHYIQCLYFNTNFQTLRIIYSQRFPKNVSPLFHKFRLYPLVSSNIQNRYRKIEHSFVDGFIRQRCWFSKQLPDGINNYQ